MGDLEELGRAPAGAKSRAPLQFLPVASTHPTHKRPAGGRGCLQEQLGPGLLQGKGSVQERDVSHTCGICQPLTVTNVFMQKATFQNQTFIRIAPQGQQPPRSQDWPLDPPAGILPTLHGPPGNVHSHGDDIGPQTTHIRVLTTATSFPEIKPWLA